MQQTSFPSHNDYAHVSESAFFWFSMTMKMHILPYAPDEPHEKEQLLHEGICYFFQCYEHEHRAILRENGILMEHAITADWNHMIRNQRQWEGMLNGIWEETHLTRGAIRGELIAHHENRWRSVCYYVSESDMEACLAKVTTETLDIFQLCLERECEWEEEYFYRIAPAMYVIKARIMNEFEQEIQKWNKQIGGHVWREAKEMSSRG